MKPLFKRIAVFLFVGLYLTGCATREKSPFDATPTNQHLNISEAPDPNMPTIEKVEDKWDVLPNKSLKETLVEWTQKANWTSVSWEVPDGKDYVFGQAGSFSGSYEDAVKALAKYMLDYTDFKIQCIPHTGNKVLQVTSIFMEGAK